MNLHTNFSAAKILEDYKEFGSDYHSDLSTSKKLTFDRQEYVEPEADKKLTRCQKCKASIKQPSG